MATKVPDVEPAGIVTEAGTVNTPELLVSVIEAPPVGAADDRVIVHEDVPPVLSERGAQDNELITVGANVTEVVCELVL